MRPASCLEIPGDELVEGAGRGKPHLSAGVVHKGPLWPGRRGRRSGAPGRRRRPPPPASSGRPSATLRPGYGVDIGYAIGGVVEGVALRRDPRRLRRFAQQDAVVGEPRRRMGAG